LRSKGSGPWTYTADQERSEEKLKVQPYNPENPSLEKVKDFSVLNDTDGYLYRRKTGLQKTK
jgi:hypothetical protein